MRLTNEFEIKPAEPDGQVAKKKFIPREHFAFKKKEIKKENYLKNLNLSKFLSL